MNINKEDNTDFEKHVKSVLNALNEALWNSWSNKNQLKGCDNE